MFCLCWYLSSTHFTEQYRKLCGTPSLCLPHSYSRGLWLVGCGYSQKGAVVTFCDSVIPFRLPAPKGLIIFNVFSLKSSMRGKKCPALNYTHPLMWTCLEDLLLGFLSSSSYLLLTSIFYNITFIPWAACVTTQGYGLLQLAHSPYPLADCNLPSRSHFQQTWGPCWSFSVLFPCTQWPIPCPSLPSYFVFGPMPMVAAWELSAQEVGSPLLHSHGQLHWLCCLLFPYVLWDLLIPFCSQYYFYSCRPKALLLHSLTLTAYSYQAFYFITLQSFHLNHWEPHALSLAGPFHLLSVPFFSFLHQILVSCLICGLHCIASAFFSPCQFSSSHANWFLSTPPTLLSSSLSLSWSGSPSAHIFHLLFQTKASAKPPCKHAIHQPNQ